MYECVNACLCVNEKIWITTKATSGTLLFGLKIVVLIIRMKLAHHQPLQFIEVNGVLLRNASLGHLRHVNNKRTRQEQLQQWQDHAWTHPCNRLNYYVYSVHKGWIFKLKVICRD